MAVELANRGLTAVPFGSTLGQAQMLLLYGTLHSSGHFLASSEAFPPSLALQVLIT